MMVFFAASAALSLAMLAVLCPRDVRVIVGTTVFVLALFAGALTFC